MAATQSCCSWSIHGITVGQSATEAFNIQLMADKWAKTILGTYAMGGPNSCPPATPTASKAAPTALSDDERWGLTNYEKRDTKYEHISYFVSRSRISNYALIRSMCGSAVRCSPLPCSVCRGIRSRHWCPVRRVRWADSRRRYICRCCSQNCQWSHGQWRVHHS